jgi:hypothetical protein
MKKIYGIIIIITIIAILSIILADISNAYYGPVTKVHEEVSEFVFSFNTIDSLKTTESKMYSFNIDLSQKKDYVVYITFSNVPSKWRIFTNTKDINLQRINDTTYTFQPDKSGQYFIEVNNIGQLKPINYVLNVVSSYKRIIDEEYISPLIISNILPEKRIPKSIVRPIIIFLIGIIIIATIYFFLLLISSGHPIRGRW